MTRHFGLVSAALLAGASAVPASVATYLFSFTGTGIACSGTFVTSNTMLTGGGFAITSTTGNATINATPFSFTGPTTFAGADNILYPTAAQYLSLDGTSVLGSNGSSHNFYYSSGTAAYRIFTSASQFITLASFTVTPLATAVPEPASWAPMIGGFGVAGGVLRASRRRAAAVAA